MKIAYVTFEKPHPKSGVGKKILTQVAAWRAAGHQVVNVVIGNPGESTPVACDYVGYPQGLKPYFGACLATVRLHGMLRQFDPDLIYARQLLWWPGSVWALSVAPLVFEINSLTAQEYRVVSRMKYLLHTATANCLLGAARGLVSVTEEIDRSLPRVPARRIVIGNGYDFSQCTARVPPNNRRPVLVFVGSSNQPWQGVDKVVRLAGLLPACDFHLVMPGFRCDTPGNVVCHGGLYGTDLDNVFCRADIAIGTLALHRKHMQEASPLKTREYLAHGLPVIAGYHDADLAGVEGFLDIGNTEDNVELALPRIVEFVNRWTGKVLPRDVMVSRLDHVSKERQRMKFFADCIGR